MDLPGNSNVGKDRTDKNLEQITVNAVSRRKKPLGQRFFSTFVAGDPKKVVQDVILDVLMPAARDMIADVVTRGFEQWIYGDSRTARSRTGSRPGGTNGYISYNRYSANTPASMSPRREEDRGSSRAARNATSLDDLVVGTRAEAETIIDRLFDIVSRWEQATVHDLYELVGITGEPIDQKWGWTSMEGSTFRRIGTGYLLVLPKIEPLR